MLDPALQSLIDAVVIDYSKRYSPRTDAYREGVAKGINLGMELATRALNGILKYEKREKE